MTDLKRAVPQMQAGSPGPPNAQPRAPTLEDDLLVAASRGQLELLRELLAAGATLKPDKDGRTALHYAAQEGHADTCIFLLARGCSLDSQDMMGYSPLLRAASQGARDVVQVLLEAGCSVNIQDEHGNAAIHETCWNGFSKTAEMLVHHNCDVFLTNKAGFTALHLAAQNGHNESSRVLLYAGCNPDMKNNYGDTALHTAARYGHAGVARILISARCKLSEQNKNGDSALHIAAALKRRKIAKILVESGTDVELINKQNETAMDVAKRKEHPEVMLIISTYAKPRPQQQHSHTHHPAVTFKEEIETVDGPVGCADDQPSLKQEPLTSTRPEKEKKAGFFFSFKRKKKDKNKEKSSPSPSTPSSPGHKKIGPGSLTPGAETSANTVAQVGQEDMKQKNTAVHGFFSRYVPRDGVQFYRDLAGNIKQGPIGYAPVCQCGPSLRHFESTLTSTKDSLHQRIDVSHHILSRRIDDIDMRTRPLHHPDTGRRGGYATDTILHQRTHRENHQSHSYHNQRMHCSFVGADDDDDDDDDDDFSGDEEYGYENSLDMGIGSRDSRDVMRNGDMPKDLEHWLTDKLASYGHCLNHHHDDSALPPRNLFTDFPHSALGIGRLVRSRSDETLSASDYSGKFRKRDFYASRQAAMQQIRGWELPSSNNKPGRKTRVVSNKHNSTENNESNRTAVNATNSTNHKKVITQAQVHNQIETERSRPQSQAHSRSGNTCGSGMLSPSTNSTTSPGTLTSSAQWINDVVSSPVVSHSLQEHQHQHQRQTISNTGQLSSGSDRSRGPQIELNCKEAKQHEAIQQHHSMSNPPYPQPPRYEHQSHQSTWDLNFSHRPPGQSDQSYSNQQLAQGSLQHHNSRNRGPPVIEKSPSKQVIFSSAVHQRTKQQQPEQSIHSNDNEIYTGPLVGLTRHQDKYGVRYNRSRALSSDALMDDNYENVDAISQHPDIQRSRSMDNTLENGKPMPYSPGCSTNSGKRPASNTMLTPRRLNSPRNSNREAQSLSPAPRATTRYRLPETSSNEVAISPNLQWQQDQRVNLPGSSVPTPLLPSYKQGLRTTENLRQANSSTAVSSSHNSGSPVHSNQFQGKGRLYVSSVDFDKKDRNHVYSGQSQHQLSLYTSSAPERSDSEHAPLQECLQHNNNLLSPHLPSMATSRGGKEDSTCSSNHDSGYGRDRSGPERPFGGGTDTSVGTPSSSFSMERSNTPSMAGSPYASQRGNSTPQTFNSTLHSRMSHTGYVSGRGRTYSPFSSGPDGSFRSSSSESHRPGDNSNRRDSAHDRFNAERGFSSPSNDSALSGNSMGIDNLNQKNLAPKYANEPMSDFSCDGEQFKNPASLKHCSSGNQSLEPSFYRASGPLTNLPYNAEIPSRGSSMLMNLNAPKTIASRSGPPPPPKPNLRKLFNDSQNNYVQNSSTPSNKTTALAHCNDHSPSRTYQPYSINNNAYHNQSRLELHAPVHSGHMTQSTVQAHVQGWYQKVVLEAADRLRQSESYSSSTPSNRTNAKEPYFTGSASNESPRQAAASASSTCNNSSRSSNLFHGYSSSSPSPSPQGPKSASNIIGKTVFPVQASTQHNYNQQQQQSSYSQIPNNSSMYYKSVNDNKSYINSSPYSRSPHVQFPAPAMTNPSSNNSARSFPSSHYQSEASNLQYQLQKPANSTISYHMVENMECLNAEDTYSKIQPHSYHASSHSNNSSDFDPYCNNLCTKPAYGLARVVGGNPQYDPIHGSDV